MSIGFFEGLIRGVQGVDSSRPFRLMLPRKWYEIAIAEGFDPDLLQLMEISVPPVAPPAEPIRQRRGKGQRKAGRRTRWH